MYLLYTLIYIIAIIFVFPFEYLKRPKELRKRWLREKFGFFDSSFISTKSPLPPFTKEGQGGIIWVHAVSVGEVMAASPLLGKLKERYLSKNIMLSTITDTGQKVAKERAPDGIPIIYLPFDIPFILKSVIRKIKPEILIVIETELWPNMFRVFKENGVPVILLNGRISENSFRGYKKISFFMKKVLSNIDLFGMQSNVYAERIKALGADDRRVVNIGNFKFDTKPPSQTPAWTEKIRGPILIAGSTHEGEEGLVTSIYVDLKKDFPELNLIIAPRHPERFKQVEDMLNLKGIQYIKRSELKTQNSKLKTIESMVILLDTVGELSAIYGISDIAVIGKSFKGYGGQNPLEPAYWGKPILCGPHMENFPVVQDFYKAGAAVEVDEDRLYGILRELLNNPEKAREMGSKAQEEYRKNTGAVKRAMEIIEGYLHDDKNVNYSERPLYPLPSREEIIK